MAGRLVDYMGSGLASALPTAATVDGDLTAGAAGFYYATDTSTLYSLNRSGTPAWETVGGGAGGGSIPLDNVTATDGQTLVTLTIPSGYKHLTVRYLARCKEANSTLLMRFNTDSGNNYVTQRNINGSVATEGTVNAIVQRLAASDHLANTFGAHQIDIPFASNTAIWKRSLAIGATNSTEVQEIVGLWKNTAAITSITFTTGGASGLVAGSLFDVYGLV
jgi:hypothetical protein